MARLLSSKGHEVQTAGSVGDALASLVPDAKLRAQLPRTLRAEPACDAVEAARAASVAATAEEHRAWTLTFQRTGARWQLTAAAPVIP